MSYLASRYCSVIVRHEAQGGGGELQRRSLPPKHPFMSGPRPWALVATLTLTALLLGSAPLRAAVPDASVLCLSAVAAAEQRQHTPSGLLAVIAKVESGRPTPPDNLLQPWPWTVDADGQGLFFDTKAKAVAWTRRALAGGTITYLDVGCMQIDLRMHPHAFRNLNEAFDPGTNAEYGARYLRELHDGDAAGNWYTAIGLYHSHTPQLAEAYRAQVAAVAANRPMPPMPSHTLRLALVGGGILRINVFRQPARVHRVLSACEVAAILGSYLPRRVSGCR